MQCREQGRKFGLAVLVIAGLILTGLWGCEKLNLLPPKKAEPLKTAPAVTVKGTIIAKINNIPVTLEDLEEEVNTYNTAVSVERPELKITMRDDKIRYLKNEVTRRTLLYQEALDRGLERDEEVVKLLEKNKQDILVVALVREEAKKVDVTSKEIEDYYTNYKDQLREPEKRQIREIVVPTEQEARDILIQLLQGADFATSAKEKSKAVSAKDGGDLGIVEKGKRFSQFDNVAFSDSLDVGKVSNIFKGPDGYYILKLEAKSGGQLKSLSDKWNEIKEDVLSAKQQQRLNDLMGKLLGKAKLEYYEGEIK